MIQGWLAGKLSGLIIFLVACTAPVFAIAAGYEAAHLHGIGIPVPMFGRIELVHGAIPDRIAAEQRRDQALKDLGTARANIQTLTAALNKANGSIADLGTKSDQATAAAQLRLAQEQAKKKDLQARLVSLEKSKVDTSSPAAAAISLDALILGGL